MPRKEYDWSIAQPPPLIGSHSLKKHRLLGAYLRRYVDKFAANPNCERLRIALVDGFAGGGLYRSPVADKIHEGSPLVMLREVRAAEAEANHQRQAMGIRKAFSIDATYYFVEKDRGTCELLEQTVKNSDFYPGLEDRINVVNNDFTVACPEVSQSIRQAGRATRAIFLLDQYGYNAVPLGLINSIFDTLPQAEVLLTFAVDSLLQYFSKENTIKYAKSLGRAGLLEHVDLDLAVEAKQQDPGWRGIVESMLINALKVGSGANFFTPFFIVSSESNRAYWFVHLARHLQANVVMKALHWHVSNTFSHYGGAGLSMLGYDPKFDDEIRPQLSFVPFAFDEEARARSTDSLIEQLPQFISAHGNVFSYGDLLALTANDTPADERIIRGALRALITDRQAIIKTPAGHERRTVDRLKAADRIELRRQLRLKL